MRSYTAVKTTARIVAVAGALAVPATAHADTYTPIYSAIHQKVAQHPTLAQASRFNALVGWQTQNIGYPERYWVYTKGTRTTKADYPESWYLHVDGVRVRDTTFNLYAMNPLNAGWRDEVAHNCPRYCFLDGVGTSSITRTKPRLQWTKVKWVKAVAGLVRHVVSTGDKVLPNSVGFDVSLARPILDAAGRGSTEAFNSKTRAIVRAGKIWVQEIGACGIKLATYLLDRGRGDHFACYDSGTLPWDIPATSVGASLGKALGKAYRVKTGVRRDFAHGHVIVHPGGTYIIRR